MPVHKINDFNRLKVNRRTVIRTKSEATPVYVFADLSFDPGQGLFRSGRRVPVPPKETQLLELLLGAKGSVVSHVQIERTLWPRQQVRYESLARCVYSLRRILRESGADCIETVPRHGYRISAPIEEQHPARSTPARLDSVETDNTTAYSYYMCALREASIPRPEKLERALGCLQKAVELDPGYNAALAGIGEVTMYQCVRGYLAPGAALRRGLKACRAALDNNPSHVSSRIIMGWFQGMIGQKLDEGLAMLDAALADDPEYAPGHAHRSWFMRAMGDAQAAVRDQREGFRLNPLSLLNRHGLAFTLFHSDDVDAAVALEAELAETYPDDDTTHAYGAVFLAYQGRGKEALESAARAMALSGDLPAVVAQIAYVEAAVGSRPKAGKLVKLALETNRNRCPRPHIVPALLELGRDSEAVDLMLASKQEHCPWLYGMRTDPRLASLLLDSRLLGLYDRA